MLNRKKTADQLLNLILYIENNLDLNHEEETFLTDLLYKYYIKIMKELYPES